MQILFDHGTPAPLIPFLEGHAITKAKQAGWDFGGATLKTPNVGLMSNLQMSNCFILWSQCFGLYIASSERW
jgi:hypothetical protein